MDKEKVFNIIASTKIIAVIRMSDTEKLSQVIEAIKMGGVKAMEIAMTTPYALDVIKTMRKNNSEDVLIGAGTVLDAETASAAIHAGADFVVSPITNFETIKLCNRYNKLVAPGAFTPTEILSAWEMGADIVKVFPATSVGPRYFKDIKGPLPQIRLMPTGGVNLENAREFIKNGACCCAIGTALLDKKAIENNEWDILTQKARAFINSVNIQE